MTGHSFETEFNYHAMNKPAGGETVQPFILGMAGAGNLDRLERMAGLVKSGAVETDMNVTADTGDTALHILAHQCRDARGAELVPGFTAMAGLLVQMGADPHATNHAGQTPSDIAGNAGFTRALGLKVETSNSHPPHRPGGNTI